MSDDVAVLDTSVIILMMGTIDPKNLALLRRFERAEETLRDMVRDGVRFVLPTPVITELCIYPREEAVLQISAAVLGRLHNMRIESFDLEASMRAGEMLQQTFASRAQGEPRDVLKVDAMIAAVAHRLKARYLLTANGRDMAKHLTAIKSAVEVVRVDEPPAKGQLRLIDQAVPGTPGAVKKSAQTEK